MKSFQLFNEDSAEAKERQLQSLKDLEDRREKAQTKSKELTGSYKERTKKYAKRVKKRHHAIAQQYQEREAQMKEKGLR